MVKVREAKPMDFERLEEILLQNEMLTCPEVDGKEAMQRIHKIMGKYFLVAEINDYVIGMIRGCYDGSRAVIHQIAVDENHQKQGIGKKLVYEIALRFKSEGAPSISVIATKKSEKFYKKLSFSDLQRIFMVSFDIKNTIKKAKE